MLPGMKHMTRDDLPKSVRRHAQAYEQHCRYKRLYSNPDYAQREKQANRGAAGIFTAVAAASGVIATFLAPGVIGLAAAPLLAYVGIGAAVTAGLGVFPALMLRENRNCNPESWDPDKMLDKVKKAAGKSEELRRQHSFGYHVHLNRDDPVFKACEQGLKEARKARVAKAQKRLDDLRVTPQRQTEAARNAGPKRAAGAER